MHFDAKMTATGSDGASRETTLRRRIAEIEAALRAAHQRVAQLEAGIREEIANLSVSSHPHCSQSATALEKLLQG